MLLLARVLGLVALSSATACREPAGTAPAREVQPARVEASREPLATAPELPPATLPSEPDTPPAIQEPVLEHSSVVRAALVEELATLHGQCGAPGINAAFVFVDGSELALSVGVAEDTTGAALTPDDRMLAGSVGKTFFAAAVLALADEGRLDLDAKVIALLEPRPWLERLPDGGALTLRHLLRHQSGLARYEFDPTFQAALANEPFRRWQPQELVQLVLDRKPSFAAGEGWEYADTNYILLALAVEEHLKLSLQDEIERRFIAPLALSRTGPQLGPAIAGLIQGHAGANDGFPGESHMLVEGRMVLDPSFEWAGGGYATTARDLARWARALYGGELLSEAMRAQMLDCVPAPMLGPEAGYGLGAIVWKSPIGVARGHSGYFPGYRTEMRYFPEHRLALAVQVNTSDPERLKIPLEKLVLDLASAALESFELRH